MEIDQDRCRSVGIDEDPVGSMKIDRDREEQLESARLDQPKSDMILLISLFCCSSDAE